MKTKIIFRGSGRDQSYQIDTELGMQPAEKTVMTFHDVDQVPDWVRNERWYVHDTQIDFFGSTSYMVPIMTVSLKTTI